LGWIGLADIGFFEKQGFCHCLQVVQKSSFLLNGVRSKYTMRIDEIIEGADKPKPPLTPAQARVRALKLGVERSREQLRQERDRQRRQREAERERKRLQQRSALL
jgi:hypothetical protein